MNIDRVFVMGFQPALYGMRNPMESWGKSDSLFYGDATHYAMSVEVGSRWNEEKVTVPEFPLIGPKDLELALKLIKAGPAHRKFLRQIIVWWNIKIPRGIWQELDTYKVATVRNSCSTMHKLGSRDLEPGDFQDEDVSPRTLQHLNAAGLAYRSKTSFQDEETGKVYEGLALLAHLKRRLPEGFLQMATYSFSYETALNMYYDREKHRMPEWSGEDGVCIFIRSLPYMNMFIAAAAGQRS